MTTMGEGDGIVSVRLARSDAGFGFSVVCEDGVVCVSRVRSDSPAAAAKAIYKGIRVLEVNGTAVSGLDREQVFKLFKQVGTELRMKLGPPAEMAAQALIAQVNSSWAAARLPAPCPSPTPPLPTEIADPCACSWRRSGFRCFLRSPVRGRMSLRWRPGTRYW